jgi:hypothetical protein
VRRLGHLPADFELEVPRGTRVEVAVKLVASPTPQPTVVVEGQRRDFLLYANGFYDRQRVANGTFLDPEFLAARAGVPLHTVLREVTRVRQVCDPSQMRCRTLLDGLGQACEPRVWVDGTLAPAGAFDEIVARQRVRAMEVYRTAPQIPIQFQRLGERCGAILVWTEQAPGWSARYLPRRVLRLEEAPVAAPADSTRGDSGATGGATLAGGASPP